MREWIWVGRLTFVLMAVVLVGGALDFWVYGVDEDLAIQKMMAGLALAFSLLALFRPEIQRARESGQPPEEGED